ncbi:hypothetical protein GCM10009754_28560 [Amycolatopsis minnesotensis]|uniref:Methyltransferase family protein n=1 Tax=Amycolatopsis minnesotensis TaxID=337894 RepID=A0ABP5C366_9PSEU
MPVMPQPLEWWRREPGASEPVDIDALDWVRDGSVIDAGCGTGRHLEVLARRGVHGYGVEMTPAAVSLAKAAGVRCVEADVFSHVPPHTVDTVLAIGGNGGMAGTVEELPAFLLRLSSWLNEKGRIVLTSTDWRRLPAGKLNGGDRPPGAYPGNRRMRFLLDDRAGPWFPWLFVDAETLERTCSAVGLRVVDRKEWQGGVVHGALLERSPSA